MFYLIDLGEIMYKNFNPVDLKVSELPKFLVQSESDATSKVFSDMVGFLDNMANHIVQKIWMIFTLMIFVVISHCYTTSNWYILNVYQHTRSV